MDKSEVEQIASFLIDVRAGLCRDMDDATLCLQLTELRHIVQRLTETVIAGQDQDLRVQLAGLEYEGNLCEREIEERLGGGIE